MTRRAMVLSARAGLVIVIIVALLRCVVFVWWADPFFDADQAVTGLMARHLAEGRAFPVFQYAQQYVLVLETWIGAPFVALAPSSTAVVKAIPAALNIVTVALLYLTLTSVIGLTPAIALIATLPLALPGPRAAKDLTDALGMNIEPLLFTVLLWRWRERPILLGITAAIGIKNREFTMYAVAALIAIDVLREILAAIERRRSASRAEPIGSSTLPLASRAFWRGRLVALVACLLTWTAIGVVKQYSSPLGPGTTTFAILADGTDNMAVASSAMCIDPGLMPHDIGLMLTQLLPLQLGVGNEHLIAGQFRASPLNYLLWWPVVAALIVLGAARGLLRAWRLGPSAATWFGLYLMVVGSQAILVYASTRCGHASAMTLRYTLLALLVPVGAIVLALEREARAPLRGLVVSGVAAWIGVCAFAHARMWHAHVVDPPRPAYRALAEYLDVQGIRFISTDYWIGYHVAFLTDERVQPITNFDRVREYVLAANANRDRTYEVRRLNQEPCVGAIVANAFYVCPPIASTSPTR